MKTKIISERYFNELIDIKHIVPRCEKTGEVITGRVGEKYTFECQKTGDKVIVKCTQSHPHHYIIIN